MARKNWGRLVSSTLSNSKKLSLCSERAALVYGVLTLPKHDGEGRLEVDDVSMLEMCGRFGMTHRWTMEDMSAVRKELVDVGLWKLYEIDDKICAEVVGWDRHQRIDRISRGSDLLDDPNQDPDGTNSGGGRLGGDRGETGGRLGGDWGETGGTRGQSNLRESNLREENSSARAKSIDDAKIQSGYVDNSRIVKLHPDPLPSSAANEWVYARTPIFEDFRKAIERPDWEPSMIDQTQGSRSVLLLSQLQDRIGTFRIASGMLLADGKLHPHLFADVVQILRVGLPKQHPNPAPIQENPDPLLGISQEERERMYAEGCKQWAEQAQKGKGPLAGERRETPTEVRSELQSVREIMIRKGMIQEGWGGDLGSGESERAQG